MGATIIDKTVPDGDAAVDYTVRGPMCVFAVRDAADPCVRSLARRLKAGTRSDEEAIRAAFEHVVRAIPYVPDPEEYEQVVAPIYTLGCRSPYPGYRPHGDCDCQSTALYALVLAMGYEPAFRVVAWRKWDYTHVNLVVTLPDGRVIPLDAVMKSGGWGRQRPATYREKFYRCPMKVRALADDGGPVYGTPAYGSPPGNAAPNSTPGGCGCTRCRSRSRRGGCCPGNAATNASPVTVNVNTGRMDARRWTDASERATIETDGSRWVQFPGQRSEREVVTRDVSRREVPRSVGRFVQRVTAQAPAARPVVMRQVAAPSTRRPVVLRVRTPLERYKEFT